MTSMRPLLCELHAHTTWSDGDLSLRELVDLYGGHLRAGGAALLPPFAPAAVPGAA
jgi:hypothetical protein